MRRSVVRDLPPEGSCDFCSTRRVGCQRQTITAEVTGKIQNEAHRGTGTPAVLRMTCRHQPRGSAHLPWRRKGVLPAFFLSTATCQLLLATHPPPSYASLCCVTSANSVVNPSFESSSKKLFSKK